jgi:hypothetical protein
VRGNDYQTTSDAPQFLCLLLTTNIFQKQIKLPILGSEKLKSKATPNNVDRSNNALSFVRWGRR